MSEYEPRPVRSADNPDLRRLEVAGRRFEQLIAEGLFAALREHREIDDGTARCIAHVLGRALGRESALAEFGRTGEGDYPTLREEYLDLYNDPEAPAEVKRWIDWFGTFLVQRENIGSGRRFMNEHLPPKLAQSLVRTSVRVGDEHIVVNIPASWGNGEVGCLIETLGELQITKDDAFQAFLSLPDVSAGTDDIMESFHEALAGTFATEEDALRALSPLEEWEADLAGWCIDNGIEPEALEWNHEPLMARLRDLYDLVEREGRIHAFVR